MSRTFNFFRRAGACSCHRYIRTAEDVCPYSKNAFVMPLTFDFLKSLLCSAREVASSVSEKTVGLFGGRTQFIPTACPLYTVGTDVLGCPNRMSAGASHRPTEEVICVTQTNLSDLEYNACNCLKAQSDSRGRLSLQ